MVVDPQRDICRYLADADALGLRIERVIETHFHADFVSGHLELAAATGAVISYGEGRAGRLPDRAVRRRPDAVPRGGDIEIRATPGHTPESISLVVLRTHQTSRRGRCSPATRCSSATSAGPICSPRRAGPADQLARLLYRSIPRPAPHPARRHPGLPRPRGRLRVRQAHVRRRRVHHRRAAGHELRAAADERGRLRRGGDRRTVGRTAATSRSRPTPTGAAATCSTTTRPARSSTSPDSSSAAREGAVVIDARSPEVVRLRPSSGVRSTSASTVDSRSTPATSPVPASRSCSSSNPVARPRPRCGWPASVSTPSAAPSSTSNECWPTTPIWPSARNPVAGHRVGRLAR